MQGRTLGMIAQNFQHISWRMQQLMHTILGIMNYKRLILLDLIWNYNFKTHWNWCPQSAEFVF